MADDCVPRFWPGRRGRLRRVVAASLIALAIWLLAAPTYDAQAPEQSLHRVTWGETLSGIALQYGVTVEDLVAANGLTDYIIRAGQQLFIPSGIASPEPAGPPSEGDSGAPSGDTTHTVRPGETLYAVALVYGVDIASLAAANGIANPDLIQPGQVLLIPGATGNRVGEPRPADAVVGPPGPGGPVVHVVRPGETLLWIALEYGASADAIAAANGIANPSLIYPGQQLVIPGGGSGDATPPPRPGEQPAPALPVLAGPSGALGVCAHLFNQDLDAVFAAVQGLGSSWVKQQVEWKLFEPSKGQIEWQALDQIVDSASASGVRLLLSVVKAPSWARPTDTDLSVDGPPASPVDYADFVGALAERYRGRVAAYEIWNEQNLWYEWGGMGRLSAAAYVALLHEAYLRIKTADPAAIVVSGGLTPTGVNDGYIAFDDVHYLSQMYAAGAAAYFDVLGAHPSGYNNPPDDSPERNSTDTEQFKGHWSFYYRRFEQLRDVMVLNGDAGKKMWFTEFGWSSQQSPPAGYEYASDNSEQEQAACLSRAVNLARQKGYVGALFVWNLNYASVAGPNDEKAGFSLVRADGSLRPAYLALAAMRK